MSQFGLFGEEPPPKPPCRLWREAIGPHDGPTPLIDLLRDELPWEHRELHHGDQRIPMPRLEFLGATKPGQRYTYSGITYDAHDLHKFPTAMWCLDAVNVFLEANDAITRRRWFNAVFVNLYRDGRDSIGWHSDDERSLGPPEKVEIASLSLGQRRRFIMRHADDHSNRHTFELGWGDLLLMGAGSQSEWQHAAPKTSRRVGPRMALTFRRLIAV